MGRKCVSKKKVACGESVSSKFGCHKMHGRVCVSKKKVACGESVSSKFGCHKMHGRECMLIWQN